MGTNHDAIRILAECHDRLMEIGVSAKEYEGGGAGYDFGVAQDAHQFEAGIILSYLCAGGKLLYAREKNFTFEEGGSLVRGVEVGMTSLLETAMACQYGGFFVQPDGEWFGMGSGPMRRLTPGEPFFKKYPQLVVSSVERALGVIETSSTLSESVFQYVAEKTKLNSDQIVLCTAPATSVVGCVQVACRVAETAGHMMFDQDLDLSLITEAKGSTIVAIPDRENEEQTMVRQNECIAHSGEVSLVAKLTDEKSLKALADKIVFKSHFPGKTFRDVYRENGCNLGKMFTECPLAFAPARVTLTSECRKISVTSGEIDLSGLQASWKELGLYAG